MLSIVISVYNDWDALGLCLRSLAEQSSPPDFEVIIVDDGSRDPAPDVIVAWARSYPLRIVREAHAGISAARNQGIRVSTGDVFLFVDADCRLQSHCLAVLDTTIVDHPRHSYFQMRLIGDSSTLVGRSEELRLTALQNHLIQRDGRIRYLNTAGFAIRREKVDTEKGLFDFAALRAEDTLLLSYLMEDGLLPLFVPGAVIQHAIPLTLIECLGKDIRSAFLERRAYRMVKAKGCRIRISNRERLQILSFMWKTSQRASIGRSAWFVLTVRQSLQRVFSLLYGFFPAQSPE